MLSRTFEAILDLAGERRYADMMIRNEMVTHEGYDIPREVFVTFFAVVFEALSESLGSALTASIEQAWRDLLNEVDDLTRT
jgi:hypothetical protein